MYTLIRFDVNNQFIFVRTGIGSEFDRLTNRSINDSVQIDHSDSKWVRYSTIELRSLASIVIKICTRALWLCTAQRIASHNNSQPDVEIHLQYLDRYYQETLPQFAGLLVDCHLNPKAICWFILYILDPKLYNHGKSNTTFDGKGDSKLRFELPTFSSRCAGAHAHTAEMQT